MSQLVNKKTNLTFWLINGGHCIVPDNKNKSIAQIQAKWKTATGARWKQYVIMQWGYKFFYSFARKDLKFVFFNSYYFTSHESK